MGHVEEDNISSMGIFMGR